MSVNIEGIRYPFRHAAKDSPTEPIHHEPAAARGGKKMSNAFAHASHSAQHNTLLVIAG